MYTTLRNGNSSIKYSHFEGLLCTLVFNTKLPLPWCLFLSPTLSEPNHNQITWNYTISGNCLLWALYNFHLFNYSTNMYTYGKKWNYSKVYCKFCKGVNGSLKKKTNWTKWKPKESERAKNHRNKTKRIPKKQTKKIKISSRLLRFL